MSNDMIIYELQNKAPVELLDLTSSLNAFGDMFKRYCDESAGDPIKGNYKLYIHEIKKGSIIAELIPSPEQINWAIENKDILAGFATHFIDIANYYINGTGSAPSKEDSKAASIIVEPVAKDIGSQITILVKDSSNVTINNYTINRADANTIQNGVRRIDEQTLPEKEDFSDVRLSLYHIKDDAKAKSGDRGIISSIHKKPVKLSFANELVKQTILEMRENPFNIIFIADVRVHRIDGKPFLYEILNISDWGEISE